MINNSISGTSLTLAAIMFLSSIGGCAKLISKCSHSTETASQFFKGARNLENLEELRRYRVNWENIAGLYKSFHSVKISEGIKMTLPDIAKSLDDTHGYDNIFEIRDETNHFYINTKSTPRNQTTMFDQWVEFKTFAFKAKSDIRSLKVLDSLYLYFQDDPKDVLAKGYQYFRNNDTIQGLVKMIETNDSCVFIEMETSKTETGFYEFSEMFLKAAIVFEPKKYVSDSVWRQGS